MKKLIFLIVGLIIVSVISSFSQVRIAVFPFMNKDGNLKLNLWCYKFQDSLTKALINRDPEEKFFRIVPFDSVESILAQLNLDPNNPQYQSDMWKAADSIHVKWVVTGNFIINGGKFLIDAYAFNMKTKLPNSKYQAKDIFKKEEKVMECIEEIVDAIAPLFIPVK
ncbi:MAG: hypothetical protein M1419_07290 [Bacteroidetes bacterium]|nr:hypothetical protein [Bacteroidota bacterium]